MNASTSPPRRDLRALVRRAWAVDRPLTLTVGIMIVTLGLTLVGLVLDPRVITGSPAWLKPAKFAVSIAVYSATLLWLLSLVRGRRRLVRAVGGVTAGALVIEQVIIVGAAALGTTSHFNLSTAAHAAAWSTMGAAIALTFAVALLLTVVLLVQRLPSPALAWGLRLGLVAALAGMGVAFLMTTATPEQLAAAEAGGELPVAGAHSVGVADGGPGLPLVGWSTVGGDLRAAHFVGLHGLQVLPLLGWLLSTRAPRWVGSRHRVALVVTAGAGYLGLIALLTWQALRGQSLVAPDGLTFGALAALVAAFALAVGATLVHARRGGTGAGS